jgi:alkylated DNA repair dioxygenase AlkB
VTIDGFTYMPEFLSVDEERALLARLMAEPYAPLRMRGQTTRREIVSYGLAFKPHVGRLEPAPAIPRYLHAVRKRAARVAGVHEMTLQQSLLTRYPSKSDIGWHVDHQSFGDIVVAISLMGDATLALRCGEEEHRLEIAARSLYVLRARARAEYQHKVTVKALRYSITLRPVVT